MEKSREYFNLLSENQEVKAEFSPEIGEDRVELETKIIDVGNLENLRRNLEISKAKLKIPERLIRDKVFKPLPNGEKKYNSSINIEAIEQKSLPDFVEGMESLGFKVEQSGKASDLGISGAPTLESNTLRIRKDGDNEYITFKTQKKSKKKLKKAKEIEPEIKNSEEVERALKDLGYYIRDVREKKRTTWEVEYHNTKIKIELNTSPDSRVKPWLEIEAPTDELVIKAAQLIGYSRQDFYKKGDKDLYKKYGLTDEEISNLKFNA